MPAQPGQERQRLVGADALGEVGLRYLAQRLQVWDPLAQSPITSPELLAAFGVRGRGGERADVERKRLAVVRRKVCEACYRGALDPWSMT